MKKKVFLITGAGSGFGRAFAGAAVRQGHAVIGTVRSREAAEGFSALDPERAHALMLDVRDHDAIRPMISRIQESTGPIDVLVNNAGYGHEGLLEESSMQDLRDQFEVNVFGAVAMIQAILPAMRERRSGHIVNVTSMGGFITMPGISYYCGSKFALEGISETLAREVRHLGIHVTAIAPGSFRTDWAGRSMVRSERSIPDYDSLFDPVRKARIEKSGHQNGDPERAAEVLLRIVEMEDPPVHLLLGSDAVGLVRNKLTELQQEIGRWESLSVSTDFGAA